MSLGREITVWCDEPGCGEWGPQGNYATTAKEARAYAARLGWKRRDGRDFCPDHGSNEPAP